MLDALISDSLWVDFLCSVLKMRRPETWLDCTGDLSPWPVYSTIQTIKND